MYVEFWKLHFFDHPRMVASLGLANFELWTITNTTQFSHGLTTQRPQTHFNHIVTTKCKALHGFIKFDHLSPILTMQHLPWLTLLGPSWKPPPRNIDGAVAGLKSHCTVSRRQPVRSRSSCRSDTTKWMPFSCGKWSLNQPSRPSMGGTSSSSSSSSCSCCSCSSSCCCCVVIVEVVVVVVL